MAARLASSSARSPITFRVERRQRVFRVRERLVRALERRQRASLTGEQRGVRLRARLEPEAAQGVRDGYAEGEALNRGAGELEADDRRGSSFGVDERAAAVAGVHGGVRLQERLAVALADAAHDPAGEREGERLARGGADCVEPEPRGRASSATSRQDGAVASSPSTLRSAASRMRFTRTTRAA